MYLAITLSATFEAIRRYPENRALIFDVISGPFNIKSAILDGVTCT